MFETKALLVRFFFHFTHVNETIHQLNIHCHESFEVEYHRISHCRRGRIRFRRARADDHTRYHAVEHAARDRPEYDAAIDLPKQYHAAENRTRRYRAAIRPARCRKTRELRDAALADYNAWHNNARSHYAAFDRAIEHRSRQRDHAKLNDPTVGSSRNSNRPERRSAHNHSG